MKRYSIIATFLLSLFCFCCSTINVDNEIQAIKTLDVKTLSSYTTSNNYALSLDNILTYANLSRPATKVGETYNITEIKDIEDETIFYVLQKESGWELLASDMRVFPIVACNADGIFEDDILSTEGTCIWLEGMVMDMKVVKHSNNEELKIPKDELEWNIAYWEMILGKNDYFKPNTGSTKAPPEIPPGNYVLVSSIQELIPYDSIPHLTLTNWTQYYPYNDYCPYQTWPYIEHAPAGSVAIAGAQMLYFLHYKDGIPEEAPQYAFVSCSVDTIFQANYMNQWGFASSIWDDMENYPASAAPLIANIGNLTNTYYSNTSSTGHADLLDDAFAQYSVGSTFTTYSSSAAVQSLLNGYPVVATGANRNNGTYYTKGYHSFIIDGYVRYRVKTTNYYTWEYLDNGYVGELPYVPDATIYVYGDPFIKYLKMTWGYGNVSQNNTNFALTDDWIYDYGDYSNNFQYDKSMIIIDD